ncbi:MAG: zinc ABC transporter substrate-binding protein [Bacilli bacterium]|nr:zinc ABC transporter substrate-binding protein [Bacilli bacterium]
MKKKLLLLFSIILLVPTGCAIKRDTMEDIKIYTSSYPTEYITESLYGKHSDVESIYPNGIINSTYTLTDEQIKQYSSAALFIFNGNSKEKNYISPMLGYNKKLKIIDSTKSIDYEYGEEELWLNPSNVLMMAKNIKEGLDEYISNQYLRNNINSNYEELKLTISKLEAKIYLMVETADDPTIIVSNNTLKFLEKYGFTIYSLDENTLTDKTIETVKNKIRSNNLNYIFMLNDEKTDIINTLVNDYGIETIKLNDLSNLSDNDRKNNRDYISIMNDNIDLLRKEVYND